MIILKEYLAKFENLAILQIKDLISKSDRARELKTILDKIALDDYITQVIVFTKDVYKIERSKQQTAIYRS